jgi:hypothetical protein
MYHQGVLTPFIHLRKYSKKSAVVQTVLTLYKRVRDIDRPGKYLKASAMSHTGAELVVSEIPLTYHQRVSETPLLQLQKFPLTSAVSQTVLIQIRQS